MVMLDARHLKLHHQNMDISTNKTKLLAKKIDPFEIKTMINNNVAKLVLPRNLQKLHPSFNIKLLSLTSQTRREVAVGRSRKQCATRHALAQITEQEPCLDNNTRVRTPDKRTRGTEEAVKKQQNPKALS